MKNLIFPLIFCAVVTACAPRSISTMEQMPRAYSAVTKKSAAGFTGCIQPKLERYPVMIGFAFEDRTALVQTRDTEGGKDIYQLQNSEMMTLVTYRRKASGNQISLYVANNHFAANRIKTDYSRMIDGCK
ncbi:MAG: hypothetical protein ACAH80_18730 [Alphaproteobacteria bacterium]